MLTSLTSLTHSTHFTLLHFFIINLGESYRIRYRRPGEKGVGSEGWKTRLGLSGWRTGVRVVGEHSRASPTTGYDAPGLECTRLPNFPPSRPRNARFARSLAACAVIRHFLKNLKKLSFLYSKRASNLSKNEVLNEKLKTVLPIVILKFMFSTPNFTKFLNP